MNDTLKVAGRIGAELGAAKAENERLREVLRCIADLPMDRCSTENDYRLSAAKAIALGALSQQTEPTDTFTAVDMATAAAQGFRDGQAAVEPAPAQDEREAFEQHPLFRGMDFTRAATHPAFYASPYVGGAFDGWLAGRATLPAQTEQHPSTTQQILDLILEQCRYWHGRDEARRGGFACLYAQAKEIADNAAPIAQTAPQVEQSWLVLMPASLTAENGAKAALMGEFSIQHEATCSACYFDAADEDCEVCCGEVNYIEHISVPWETIKDIYAAAVKACATPSPAKRGDA
ncbi:hypothetical protein [Stutzerimonas nitrititolerans]|uniref:hypothetical protein n=1 Tax=Stutzerimonas nitrititolerans TaxID=2482751 RepID=UPI00289AA346|nr:hypothetical protein [Stutzerimonas nitrititolerans]